MYYRGDYYRGDYYRGDFFGGLKKIGGALLGGVKGFVTGGPVGAVAGVARGLLPSPALPKMIAPPAPMSMVAKPPSFGGFFEPPDVPRSTPGAVPKPGFEGALERFLPFGESGFTAAPAGYRINKAYKRYLIAKLQGRDVQNPFSEPRARNVIVKVRRMQATNARALGRALSRAYGFKRIAMRTLRLLSPTRPKRFGGFKKKR